MSETVLKTNNDRVSVPVLGGTIAFSFCDRYDWNLEKKVPVPVYGEIRLYAGGRRRRSGIRISEQRVVRQVLKPDRFWKFQNQKPFEPLCIGAVDARGSFIFGFVPRTVHSHAAEIERHALGGQINALPKSENKHMIHTSPRRERAPR